jgi:integrase
MSAPKSRRSYSSGSLYVHQDAAGSETWYGRWYKNGERIKRRIGPKRKPGTREGLTKPQAEQQLRELMATELPTTAGGDRLTLADAGAKYRAHLQAKGLKRSTLTAAESVFRVWLDPQLGDRALDQIKPEDVEDLMRTMAAEQVSAKSQRNYVGTLSTLYRFAMHPRRRWAVSNPVDSIELPKRAASPKIRYLTTPEVESLAAAAVKGEHEAVDRALYVTAAMTGLRQGELLALRWSELDWAAQKIRVERSHVLGEMDTPKSERSKRAVPMSMRVARELDTWHQGTRWGADGALVFAEPATGEVLRRGALMRRYRQALKAAKLEPTHRFHDLRHTFGTAMAGAGVPIRTLQAWMGHERFSTTEIYAHYVPSPEEAAMVDRAFADPLAGVEDSAREPIEG